MPLSLNGNTPTKINAACKWHYQTIAAALGCHIPNFPVCHSLQVADFADKMS